MSKPSLSKSRFMSGSQCHLRLWYETHARELASPPDDNLQAIFDTGHEVGELACKRHPGGHLIAHDYLHTDEALDETRRILTTGRAPALFEAAFRHQGVLVRVDILERLPEGGWGLIEVKSATRLKEAFVLDAAVQLWVLRGAGLDVRELGVLTLNRDYVYEGGALDLDALFRLHPVLDSATGLLDAIGEQVQEMQSMLTGAEAPDVSPGDHCFSPYSCPYYAHCTRDIALPDHGIDELPWLAQRRRAQLEASGINEIRNVPEDFPLNDLQRVVRQSIREGRGLMHGDLQAQLASLKEPVRYLDFETFAPAIPRFSGTRPYDAIPFLFSVHVERNGGTLEHIDHLHEGSDDPRPRLAERLLDALGRTGTICTYSNYERRVLRDLAAALPERAAALGAIQARLFDLLPVVRNNYYHPAFRGSFSIKRVLPALVPESGYDDLSIADGQTAAARYVAALGSADSAERRRTFEELRAYCAWDTLAMVELRRALGSL
ncbi:MAG: DUF2779 domain-containing protein [Gammaproteobacteria bacterium]|nr:DUF2779 domain-containing protein [Gammaproteobacteria bacterium]